MNETVMLFLKDIPVEKPKICIGTGSVSYREG